MFEVACLSVLAKLVTCAGCILACTSDSWVLVQTCFSGFLQACSPSAHVGYFPQLTAWLFSLLGILNLPLVWQMMQKVMQKWKKKKVMKKKMKHLHNKDHLSSFPYEDIPKTVKMKLITFDHCLLVMHIMFLHIMSARPTLLNAVALKFIKAFSEMNSWHFGYKRSFWPHVHPIPVTISGTLGELQIWHEYLFGLKHQQIRVW